MSNQRGLLWRLSCDVYTYTYTYIPFFMVTCICAEMECRVWGAKQHYIGTTSWKTSSDSTATLGQRRHWILDLIRTVGTPQTMSMSNKITPLHVRTSCTYCKYTQEYSIRGVCTLSWSILSLHVYHIQCTHMHLHLTFTHIHMYVW